MQGNVGPRGRSSCWSSRHKAHCQRSVPRGAVRARPVFWQSILLLQNGVIRLQTARDHHTRTPFDESNNVLWCHETGQGPGSTRRHEKVHVQRRFGQLPHLRGAAGQARPGDPGNSASRQLPSQKGEFSLWGAYRQLDRYK